MENLALLRVELLFFILSISYFFYYIYDYILNIYYKIRKVFSWPKNIEEESKWKINMDKEVQKVTIKRTYNPSLKNLTEEERQKIAETLKRIKVNVEKWYFDIARSLIIEWLTIDKYNKELNIELANIYEKERNYKNAEYIYKDLAIVHQDNTVILRKLAYILAMQWNIKESVEMYEKVHEKVASDNETIEILASLTYEDMDFEKALKYLKLVLKEKPKNIEVMKMKALSLERLWKLKDSILVYEEILEIRPYDTQTIDNIKRIEQNIVNS